MTAPADCEPLWLDDDPDWDDGIDIDPRVHDLRGQGLTAIQLYTIQDIETRGDLL